METFDPEFEQMRLEMLAMQYPDMVVVRGKVTFFAMDDEDRIAKTRWELEKDIFDELTDSGFKIHLINLLDDFIVYRARCKKSPRKRGVVSFENGVIGIEWLK